jgi:GTP-binding protein
MGIDKVEQLAEWLAQHPTAQGVAFVGRSNVGKSSLINKIFGNSVARVSKTPGRTRQVNIFRFQWQTDKASPPLEFYLFDVPGYGHAEVSKEMARNWQNLLDTFFRALSGKVLLLSMQDARHPLQEADLQFQDYVQQFELETYLVFNKLDKLKTQSEKAQLQKRMPDLYKASKWVKQIHFVSAETGTGVPPLIDAMMNFLLRV